MESRIKQVRKEAQLSQEAFGKCIGITGASVSRLESGENSPSEQTLRLICREFGISYPWLKHGAEPMKMPAQEVDMGKLERIMNGDNTFAKFVFRYLADLPEASWRELETLAERFVEEKKTVR